MESKSVALESLVGEHVLMGVDSEQIRPDGAYEDATALRFVLDGLIYVVTEDPSDGYRSCLGSVEIVEGPPVKNMFPPCRVLASMATGSSDEVLELRDVTTGKVVLQVGTDNSDNYYPSFVGNFTPEHMAVNS